MCGIVGYWAPQGELSRAIIERMTRLLSHRGPDDEGLWLDDLAGVALGHRRLSILDLSPAGHQPMLSYCNRYVIVFNGEIYNHQELRSALEAQGHSIAWRGHSDTEILINAISVWGIESTLRYLVGMFAFAVWDRKERRLWLARDRIGEKPLYYGYQSSIFMFASELKALLRHPAFEKRISTIALDRYLNLGYVPAPLSIYEGIYKLPPGTHLTLNECDVRSLQLPSPQQYWRPPIGEVQAYQHEQEAIEQLETLLRQAIRGQMIADVPVGAFLSGGIDSSSVVALMQAESSRPVRTFTVGFNEPSYNEAPYAKAVAEHLGTDHTELYVAPRDVLDLLPCLPHFYDEPFADSSQLPTYLIARLARGSVAVCFSGDGGDELFAGYSRYYFTAEILRRLSVYEKLPYALRIGIARLIAAAPTKILNWAMPASYRERLLTKQLLPHHQRHLVQILQMRSYTIESVYQFLMTEGDKTRDFLLSPSRDFSNALTSPGVIREPYTAMTLIDLVNYLPDDILVKVDRATMAVSLESRIPLLDHRIVEFALRLPVHLKVRGGQGKWILRQLLYRYVPPDLVDHPKTGFGVPIHAWLRSELREWAEDLLSEIRLGQSGLLQVQPIRKIWQEHLNHEYNWEYLLWKILVLQEWLGSQ